MTDMADIDDLITRLMNLEYKDKGDTYSYKVIFHSHKPIIEQTVKTWWAEQTTSIDMFKRIGELEAKVYAYEKIIANSNFKPLILTDKTEREE